MAVVCVVGKNSRRGGFDEKLDTTSKTQLQTRLDILGATLTKWAIYSSLAIFVACLFHFIINVSTNPAARTFGFILNSLSLYVTQFVTIIIVAVPEGLPLAITMSLAYSVMRMKGDGVLIKDLSSPEVMGRVD